MISKENKENKLSLIKDKSLIKHEKKKKLNKNNKEEITFLLLLFINLEKKCFEFNY